MGLLSIQILLINFIVAGIITAFIYFSNKKIRHFNPLLLFIISSIGTFLGTSMAMLLPQITFKSNTLFINNIIISIPGILLSVLFIYIWIKGSKSEGYV